METDAEANARSEGSGSTPLIQLQSKELEEILNVIDQLRSEGVSKYINLPQLIVCGDQSSGKSSVLEALSGLAFPTRDNICTRFATELILRRLPESGVKASIHPDDDRPKTEKERIRKFKSPTVALDQFAKLVEGAEEFLGVGREGHPFSKDVLRVEVKGPTQPDLTLVDLPGLYHAPDESQDEEGVEFVESLVQSYISNKRSVILAVISAKSDIALQKVTAFTRKFDPNGSRTMGIITKPDTLPAGSDMEGSFYQLAMNKRVSLRLGWHVLKNRKYEERHFSLEQRRESESQFLATGVWRRVPRARVGIDSLRPRLSTILTDHIISQLPGLISEAQQEVKEANAGLQKLGTARGTISDQRRYLLHGSEKFTALLRNAIDGIYFDSYFGNAITDEGYERRLRAVIQNRLADFSNTMWRRGEQIEIIDDTEPSDVEDGNDGLLAERKIKRSKFVDEVQQRMRRSRGRELPGTYNPLIIGELFYLQSAPWEAIVNQQCEILLEDVQKAIVPILREVLDEKSVAQLLRHVIEPSLRKLEESLRSTTENLLKPQKAGHPITYNHYFTECIQKARERHFQKSLTEKLENFFGENYPSTPSSKYSFAFRMDALIEALGTQTETDMERFACSEAIDCMTAYYTVARKKFVDDFSILAVEKCLLEPLVTIFCPGTLDMLSDHVVEDIAAEDEASRLERERLQQKSHKLQKSLSELHRLDRYSVAMRRSGGLAGAEDDDGLADDGMELQTEPRAKPLSSTLQESLHEVDEVDSTEGVRRVTSPFPPPDVEIDVPRLTSDSWNVSLYSTTSKRKKKHSLASRWE